MKALVVGALLVVAGLVGLVGVDPRAENLLAVLSPAAIVAGYCLLGWGLAGPPAEPD